MIESENTHPPAAAQTARKVRVSKLEKLIGGALAKLRNAWMNKSSLTGIQFYSEIDD